MATREFGGSSWGGGVEVDVHDSGVTFRLDLAADTDGRTGDQTTIDREDALKLAKWLLEQFPEDRDGE